LDEVSLQLIALIKHILRLSKCEMIRDCILLKDVRRLDTVRLKLHLLKCLWTDPWQFLIKDHESESKFKFQLRESLDAASRTDLLAGYSVYVTPKVKPSPSEMKGEVLQC
jgi:hypothetical protein